MPKQMGEGFVFGQLALSGKALRLEEERIEALEERCTDPEGLAAIRADRDACEDAQDALWDYVLRQAEALDRARDAWALSTLKGEPSVADLKVRAIPQRKTAVVLPATA